jgi:putative transposase
VARKSAGTEKQRSTEPRNTVTMGVTATQDSTSEWRELGAQVSYYAWRKRQPSQRSETDAALLAEIQVAHASSRGTYGAPRIHAELAAKGTYIGRKRVARLMTQAGLAGVSRRRFVTTTAKDGGRQAPDLVERNFTAEAPDRLWVADITYIPTWAGVSLSRRRARCV